MSTRANITIKNGESKIILYRHYDGYPTNTGIDIANRIKRSRDTSALVSDFLDATFDSNDRKVYEITSEIHGDIEYDYEITVPKFGYNFYHKDTDGNYTNMPTVTVKERKIIETFDDGARDYLVSWTTIHENETHDTLLPIWSRVKDKELVTFANGKKVNELTVFGIEAADIKEARERLKKDEY